jgi:hypothetical protein
MVLELQIHAQSQERQKHQRILDIITSWTLTCLNRQYITNIVGHLVPHLHKLPKKTSHCQHHSS